MTKSLSLTLRPYLSSKVQARHQDAYLRFFAAAASIAIKPKSEQRQNVSDQHLSPVAYRHRLRQLNAFLPQDQATISTRLYPRVDPKREHDQISFHNFVKQNERIKPGNSVMSKRHTIQGRVQRVRTMSRKLLFVDVKDHSENSLQVMISFSQLQKQGAFDVLELDNLKKAIGVGDHWVFSGIAHRTTSGQLTLSVLEMPSLLSPRLHVLPRMQDIQNEETLSRFPQFDLTLNASKRELLKLRHTIERTFHEFFDEKGFTKVSTPILAADTGGAAARPFETHTNEISGVPLRLRIAPELALKKLVAASVGPVYEIGPCFRNEGLDGTHNPEFTTCEFYLPYASLEHLITMTEELLNRTCEASRVAIQERLKNLPSDGIYSNQYFSRSKLGSEPKAFARLPFLPTLLSAIRQILPEFAFPRVLDDTAAEELLAVLPTLDLKVPSNPSTSRILDQLASHFIEPLCSAPTFITEHPAIMSPLAKCYMDHTTGHLVSARAELFINTVEYTNLYEEENNPFLQAKNFLQQAAGSQTLLNEFGVEKSHEQIKRLLTPGQQYYVTVLEMGLPPTGGWGCGLDRLVMLFGGAKRISDVLPFGNLRNVVAMGTAVDKGKLIVDRAADAQTDTS